MSEVRTYPKPYIWSSSRDSPPGPGDQTASSPRLTSIGEPYSVSRCATGTARASAIAVSVSTVGFAWPARHAWPARLGNVPAHGGACARSAPRGGTYRLSKRSPTAQYRPSHWTHVHLGSTYGVHDTSFRRLVPG